MQWTENWGTHSQRKSISQSNSQSVSGPVSESMTNIIGRNSKMWQCRQCYHSVFQEYLILILRVNRCKEWHVITAYKYNILHLTVCQHSSHWLSLSVSQSVSVSVSLGLVHLAFAFKNKHHKSSLTASSNGQCSCYVSVIVFVSVIVRRSQTRKRSQTRNKGHKFFTLFLLNTEHTRFSLFFSWILKTT